MLLVIGIVAVMTSWAAVRTWEILHLEGEALGTAVQGLPLNNGSLPCHVQLSESETMWKRGPRLTETEGWPPCFWSSVLWPL